MKKYWLIIQNTWAEYTAYRLNFILWRVRMVIRFLITYFLWSTIYSGDGNFFGYTRTTMLTYVVMVYVVSNIVFATRTQDMGAEINEGKLSNHLLKPISYFKTVAARDIGDKLLNFGFTVVETIVLVSILQPPLFFQTDPLWISLSIAAFVAAVVIYFCLSSLLSMIGFWSTEVWATRFIFMILLDFIAGGFFPIDIFPEMVRNIVYLTPFPYIFYFPVKLYLGGVSMVFVTQGILVMLLWALILKWAVERVWRSGLKVYGAEGR